jgi:hypothetical protein
MTAAKPEHKNVTEALAAVMAELPAIGKDGKADPSQGGYSYRGIEAITSHAQALLGKHGVVPFPRVVGEPKITPITINNKPWTDTMLMVEYRFKHGPTDTEEIAIGRDNSDKGANKCMTQAFKYALIQVLCIGDKKDDSDGESHVGDETQSGPPWFEQLGYLDADHARATNDALRELVNEALQRPREAREPMKAWLAEKGYDTWLPVRLSDSAEWAHVLRKVLDEYACAEPTAGAAPPDNGVPSGRSEGSPASVDGGAGAPSDPLPAGRPAVTDEGVAAAVGRAKETAKKPQGARKKSTGTAKTAAPKPRPSEHLDNGELRVTEGHLTEIHALFTRLAPGYDRERKLEYTRNVLAAQWLKSSWDLSDAQAVELIDHLRIAVGDAPPPGEPS